MRAVGAGRSLQSITGAHPMLAPPCVMASSRARSMCVRGGASPRSLAKRSCPTKGHLPRHARPSKGIHSEVRSCDPIHACACTPPMWPVPALVPAPCTMGPRAARGGRGTWDTSRRAARDPCRAFSLSPASADAIAAQAMPSPGVREGGHRVRGCVGEQDHKSTWLGRQICLSRAAALKAGSARYTIAHSTSGLWAVTH